MSTKSIPTYTTGVQIVEEAHEFIWKFENMSLIQNNQEFFNAQIVTFGFGKPSTIQSKWKMRLVMTEHTQDIHCHGDLYFTEVYYRPYVSVELLEYKFPSPNFIQLKSLLVQESKTGTEGPFDVTALTVKNLPIEEPKRQFKFSLKWDVKKLQSEWTKNNGSCDPFCLKVKIVIEAHKLMDHSENEMTTIMHELHTKSIGLLQKDLVSLCSSESGDIKISCSDGVELNAHAAILKARNEVFASMLDTDMKECRVGIIEVADISSQTMKILQEYFYTGVLNSAWCDPDIVYELTYAAGKYQLTDILEAMDKLLGTEQMRNVCSAKLLKLANQLSLDNAEKRLITQFGELVLNSENSDEFLVRLEH